jgi:tetratricopeptide (TPR) repeat protein
VLGEPAKGEAQLLLGLQLIPRIRGGAPRIAANLYANLCDARSFQGRYADALAACRQALALYRVVDPSILGAVLHDSAFMALKTGEPVAEAEAMFREARQFPRPAQPAYHAVIDGRLGMLRLRQGDLEGGDRLLWDAEPALRGKDEPLIEIVPVLSARAFGEHVRGRYAEAVRLMSEALDLVTRKQAAFMGPDDMALQLAAYEALAGDRSALSRLREVQGRLTSRTVAPVDWIRHDLWAGIVEARFGSKISAGQHLRSALATQQKEMSRQPDLSVEIYVRLVELLRASGRREEAAEAARQGLIAAARAYGSYFAGHPFVLEMRSR